MGLRELMRSEGPKVEPETANSLEYLQRIYRDPAQPIGVRMRAAIEAMPYENPKLSAVAVGYVTGQDFATKLDRAIERSNGARVIEGRVIEDGEERS